MSGYAYPTTGGSRSRYKSRRVVLTSMLIALLTILALLAFPCGASATSFSDVANSHPYAFAIAHLTESQAISGYTDGSFKPDANVLRQHFAKMVVRALQLQVSEADVCTFRDVAPIAGADGFYPDNYIAVAYRAGITKGSADPTKYDPGSNIRRTQLITMVVRAAKEYAAWPLEIPSADWLANRAVTGSFTDATHGDNVHVAEYNGLLDGITLQGWELYGYATRGEVAQILSNMIRIYQIQALEVNSNGSGDYTTLQAAVAAAPANSVVVVTGGTYVLTSTLNIQKSLHLVTPPGGAVAVECPQTVLRVYVDGVFSARNFTFRHTGGAAGHGAYVDKGLVDFSTCSFQDGVYDESSSLGGNGLRMLETVAGSVRNCTATGNDLCGVWVSGYASASLLYNTCVQNGLHGLLILDDAVVLAANNDCSANGANGILVGGSAQGYLTGNICDGNDWSGIAYDLSAQGSAGANVCTENGSAGIWLGSDGGLTIESNDCSENGYSGIRVVNSAQPELRDNWCDANESHGIRYEDDAAGTAEDNRCSLNGLQGIAVGERATPLLEDNACFQNAQAGIAYFETSGGTARSNDCYGNKWGIYVKSTATPTLSGNNCHDNTTADVVDERG